MCIFDRVLGTQRNSCSDAHILLSVLILDAAVRKYSTFHTTSGIALRGCYLHLNKKREVMALKGRKVTADHAEGGPGRTGNNAG